MAANKNNVSDQVTVTFFKVYKKKVSSRAKPVQRAKASVASVTKKKPAESSSSDESSDEAPAKKRPAKSSAKALVRARPTKKAESRSDDSSEEEAPREAPKTAVKTPTRATLAKAAPAKLPAKATLAAKRKDMSSSGDSSDGEPPAKKQAVAATKAAAKPVAKKHESSSEDSWEEGEKPTKAKKERIMTNFDHVPDEILYKIVSMVSTFDLCRLAKVSQRLYRVCADKRLWISVSLTRQEITLSNMKMLIESTFPIRKLDLTGSSISETTNHPSMSSDFYMTLGQLDQTNYAKWEEFDSDDSSYISERSNSPAYEVRFSDSHMTLEELVLTRFEKWDKYDSDDSSHRSERSSDSHITVEKLDLTNYGKRERLLWDRLNDSLYILERSRTKELILDGPIVLPDSKLFKAISRHENLEVLSMKSTLFLRVTFDNFQTLFNGCNRLKELNFDDCLLDRQQLRAVCHHIPETIEKLLLHPNDVFRIIYDEMDDSLVESYGVLFYRAKNLKYIGAPIVHLKMPGIINGIIQHQNLETLRLRDDDILKPHLFSVLEKVVPTLKKIDIFLTDDLLKRAHNEVQAQLEKLREVSIAGIEMDIFQG